MAAFTWESNVGTSPISCSDNKGNSYTTTTAYDDGGSQQALAVCYAKATTGGSSFKITASLPANTAFRRIIISEYSGVAAASFTDGTTGQGAAAGNTSTDGITTGSVTTTVNGDLIYGAFMDTEGSNTITAGTGFTQRAITGTNSMTTEDRQQTTAGSVAATQTFGTVHRYDSVLVTFKPTAATLTDTYANNIFSLTQNGAATFRNFNDSSTAFSVQDSNGASMLNVDTSSTGTSGGIVTIKTTSGSATALQVKNSAGVTAVTVEARNDNFGSLITANAFMGLNSYFGEEFSRSGTSMTSATAHAWGDGGSTTDGTAGAAFFSTGETGTCSWGYLDTGGTGPAGGVGRITASATSTRCTAHNSTTAAGTISELFDVDNLPLIYMKVRPSVASTGVPDSNHRFFLGLSTAVSATPASGVPTNFIGFTNCSDSGGTTCDATWRAQANTASAPTTCTGSPAVSETSFAVLVIKVISNTSIQFWIDNDVTDGINLQLCTTISSIGSTAPMSSMLKTEFAAGSNASILDVDYFRAWQDDNVGTTNPTENPGYVPPLTADSGTRQDQIGIINFTQATSEDTTFNKDVYVRGTLFADKIRANQIEGAEVYTDQLASLQQRLDHLESGGGGTITTASLPIDIRVKGSLSVDGQAEFHGNAFFYNVVTFVEKTVFKQDLTLEGHVITGGETPTIATLVAAGLTTIPQNQPDAILATAAVTGNDTSGQVTLQTGTNAAVGEAFALTFKRPFITAPRVFITPANADSARVGYYISSTPEGFKLITTSPLVVSQTLQFNYLVVQ